ncbi:methyltransferase domain-containing protein [Dankookia sp. GCM10030260]|uniref:methyltransferase domain-containing protein n=1 Tax=Dankookia sp. GCM10030260 TaxID=3273390 RepID=UPI00360B388C
MHDTAHTHARLFFENYWQPEFATVAELGSYDVNGRLRDHAPPGVRYVGMDMAPGPGVDVVVAPGAPLPLADASVDVAVTSSCFEHDIAFWDSFLELIRILRPGGLLYLNAPSNYAVHRYPLDCWRFYPDAGLALCQWAGQRGVAVELAESFIGQQGGEGWCDFVAVFRKAGPGALRRRGRIAGHAPGSNILDGGAGGEPVREAERGQTDEMLAIDGLRATLAERDAALARQAVDLGRQEAALAAREAELAALRAEGTARAAAHDDLAGRLAAREGDLAACAGRLAESEAAGTALADRLAGAEAALGAMRAEAAAGAAALAQAEGHLRRVLGSRSWQLTAPLRAVLTLLHRH